MVSILTTVLVTDSTNAIPVMDYVPIRASDRPTWWVCGAEWCGECRDVRAPPVCGLSLDRGRPETECVI